MTWGGLSIGNLMTCECRYKIKSLVYERFVEKRNCIYIKGIYINYIHTIRVVIEDYCHMTTIDENMY